MQERIQRITPTTMIVGIDIAKEVRWARITDYRGLDLMKPTKHHQLKQVGSHINVLPTESRR